MPGMSTPVTLGTLWLPIVVSAVIVFVASAIIWMGFKFMNADWQMVSGGGEDQLREAVRKLNLAPGQYVFPHMMASADRAAAMKKWEEGPVGVLLLRKPAKFSMGKTLVQGFIWMLVISLFAGYVSSHALERGADYLRVFQVAGSSAFMAHGLGIFPEAIWFGRSWKNAWKTALTGLLYACLVAGTFGWLWPR